MPKSPKPIKPLTIYVSRPGALTEVLTVRTRYTDRGLRMFTYPHPCEVGADPRVVRRVTEDVLGGCTAPLLDGDITYEVAA